MEAEIDRMKTLLSEAITTLCRNGLKYSQELSVEGLIGVTLDKKDIFLVSVKEIFCVPTKEDEDNSETRSQERVAKKRFGTSDAVKPKKLRKKGSSNERRVLETGEISSDSASEDEEEDKGSTTGSSLERGSQRRKSSDLIVIEDIDDIAIKREKHDRSCDESQLILPSEKVNVTEASRTYSGQTEEQDYSPSTDPRSEHPAGISVTDQKVFTQIVKQESVSDQSDQDLSMFTELSGEIIRMPHSLGKARSKPVPVAMNMVPGMSTDQGNCSQSEFPGSPSDWPAASASSEFPPLFGEGVTPQTPQASGSNQGASPQNGWKRESTCTKSRKRKNQAEKQREYRERKKRTDPAYLQKERIRIRKYYVPSALLDSGELEKRREKNRLKRESTTKKTRKRRADKQREYRERKKLTDPSFLQKERMRVKKYQNYVPNAEKKQRKC